MLLGICNPGFVTCCSGFVIPVTYSRVFNPELESLMI
jgi:hypothetical protein